jgi:hypothetical protein
MPASAAPAGQRFLVYKPKKLLDKCTQTGLAHQVFLMGAALSLALNQGRILVFAPETNATAYLPGDFCEGRGLTQDACYFEPISSAVLPPPFRAPHLDALPLSAPGACRRRRRPPAGCR